MADILHIEVIKGIPQEISALHVSSLNPLVYTSAAYIDFLKAAIPDSQLFFIVASELGRAVGYLPLVGLSPRGYGMVLNSLPFFGSHGGPIVDSAHVDPLSVQRRLILECTRFAEEQSAMSLTVIENPLSPWEETVLDGQQLVVVDDRIGQFTDLPGPSSNTDCVLMDMFHQKTRNAIRKGQKLGLSLSQVSDMQSLRWLQEVHEQSISRLGGVPKSFAVLTELVHAFPLGVTSRLYLGKIDERPVSGLLILISGDTWEYFIPAVVEDYRDQQALSALVCYTMIEAVASGAVRWNWGGTWRSQEGVYRFKSRFGARDMPYRYFHRRFDDRLLQWTPTELKAAFPFFYTHRYNT